MRKINRLSVKHPFLVNGRDQAYLRSREELLGARGAVLSSSLRLGKIEEFTCNWKKMSLWQSIMK